MLYSFTSESPAALEHSSLGADDTLKLSFSVTQNGEGFQPHQAMVQFLPVAESERTRGHDYLAVVKVRKGGKARWEVVRCSLAVTTRVPTEPWLG